MDMWNFPLLLEKRLFFENLNVKNDDYIQEDNSNKKKNE